MKNNNVTISSITPDWKIIITTGGQRMVHARGCTFINDWDVSGCEQLAKFKPKKHIPCPTCVRLCYATLGAKDYTKNYKAYKELLSFLTVSLVKRLYSDNKAKTILVGKKLYIQMKEDNWYIDFNYEVQLFHNNYNMKERESGQEWSSIGYHEHLLTQQVASERFSEAIREICHYDYEKATEKHRAKRAARKIEQNKKKRRTFGELNEYDPAYWGL